MTINNFGSLCSGIEAASMVLEPLGIKPLWYSEIAPFPNRVLAHYHPEVDNLGDMNDIPQMIQNGTVDVPDFLCGGTPCQAFSLAGWKNGLNDSRGQLTLKYIEILDAIDTIRTTQKKDRTVFFWENVEGVLKDKTNAFGCFLSGLVGLDEPLVVKKWANAGVLYGKTRNVAWRVLDAKYFGLAQQRKRIYVIGGGKNFHPEKTLFEIGNKMDDPFKAKPTNKIVQFSLFEDEVPTMPEVPTQLSKVIRGNKVEVFRTYSDCLYAAYGTKWNGNAAAFNGSLYIAQNDLLRRLTPKECERLMGFPDDYTRLEGCRDTNRFQAVGNSWAVPVIRWIITRLVEREDARPFPLPFHSAKTTDYSLWLFEDFEKSSNSLYINASSYPYDMSFANMLDIVDVDADEKFYITEKGCAGILRRKREKSAGMNKRLEEVLINICEKAPNHLQNDTQV